MFVIYNRNTGYTRGKEYQRIGAAQRAADKFNEYEQTKRNPQHYAIMDQQEYEEKINVMVERINIQSGQPYMEKLNTPGFMSPASEAYWSF